MIETIIQEPIELKFDVKAATMMNGEEVFQIEELVKINEMGEHAFFCLTVPAELAKTKTFKLTITTYGDQILEKDLKNKDYWNN
jgi:xylose isomerase